MRIPVLALLVCLAAPPPAAAQLQVELDAGVVLSSPLVRDSILVPLSLRTVPALTVGVRVSAIFSEVWRVGLAARTGSSDLKRFEGDTALAVTSLTVREIAGFVRRQVASAVALEGTAGIVLYDPSATRATIFQEGTPRPLLLGIAVLATLPINESVSAGVRVSYDAHRFGTESLRGIGVRDKRVVHRGFVGLTIAWQP